MYKIILAVVVAVAIVVSFFVLFVGSGFIHEIGHTLVAWLLGAEIDLENWVTIEMDENLRKSRLLATGIGYLPPGLETYIMLFSGGGLPFLLYIIVSLFLWLKRNKIKMPNGRNKSYWRKYNNYNYYIIIFSSIAIAHLAVAFFETFLPEIYKISSRW